MFDYQGIVIHGLHHGESFGFPTANIQLPEGQAIESGVYAVLIYLNKKQYKGMLYVGTRPTLCLTNPTIEINIFDFDKNIYGETVSFNILQKVREEQKFSSVNELIRQLKNDKAYISKLF